MAWSVESFGDKLLVSTNHKSKSKGETIEEKKKKKNPLSPLHTLSRIIGRAGDKGEWLCSCVKLQSCIVKDWAMPLGQAI
jgi:hypothetical protein